MANKTKGIFLLYRIITMLIRAMPGKLISTLLNRTVNQKSFARGFFLFCLCSDKFFFSCSLFSLAALDGFVAILFFGFFKPSSKRRFILVITSFLFSSCVRYTWLLTWI